MQTTLRSCVLFSTAIFLAAAILVWPSAARAQAPSATTVIVDADNNASVSVVGPGRAAFAQDRVIVRYRAGTSHLPGSAASRVLSPALNVHLVNNPPGLSVANVLARYRANPNVVYAEPDYVVNAIDVTPTDPDYLTKQWDLEKISSRAAWGLIGNKDASSIVVAVVDTGIDYTHPQLVNNLYNNGGVHGYTCMNGSCVPGGFDDYGHGTHVAGTIGAQGNDGITIAGINWKIQLLSIKFLGSGGSGSISDAVLGFNKLLELKGLNVNVRVTNNSWGGGGYSQALKDSMAALENGTPGTLNVCAAGNSGLNADFSPMYPAAYDNRGIVSVLATDSGDIGAGFTNFGLASVDIAAPGVSTYSTVPTGGCSLCDPTGYKYLSGTSMASPHVAGVAAALFALHPTLRADEARDEILRPDSYDVMSDPKARSTSTGGRLNFYDVLNNSAFFNNPIVLNQFPSVTPPANVFATGGQMVSFAAPSASDPDDSQGLLRFMNGRGPINAGSAWLFGWEVSQLFPASATPAFPAPLLAHTAAVPYDTSVADNRGGGASARSWAVVSPVGPGSQPTGTLIVPASGSVNVPVQIQFTANDPQATAWDIWASGNGGSSGSCCFTGSSVSLNFSAAGVYRVAVQAIDRELNTSDSYSSVIAIGSAPAVVPPIARATLDKDSGPAPLTVNIDMSASEAAQGISYYYIGCGGGFTVGQTGALGTCSFDSPGTYWLLLQVRDNLGYMGLISKYVVVTPPAGQQQSDTTPPTVTIKNPTSGANLTGTVNLQATAADNQGGTGVKEVEYFLDDLAHSLGKSSTAPDYTVSWNTSGVASGTHTILAVARDNATPTPNQSSPATVLINVAVVLPSFVTFTASPNPLAKKGTLTMAATVAAGTFGIRSVDFFVAGSLIYSDTAAPYGSPWKAPAAAKTYNVQARVYDGNGNVVNSIVIPVVVK